MNLIIIEKYEAFLNYIYPIAQNMPRKHGALRDLVLRTAISQVDLFYRAVKSSQKSKLYEADTDKLAMFIASWYGHLSFTDSRNLINHIQGVYQWKLVKNH